jgi:hypothetical protein
MRKQTIIGMIQDLQKALKEAGKPNLEIQIRKDSAGLFNPYTGDIFVDIETPDGDVDDAEAVAEILNCDRCCERDHDGDGNCDRHPPERKLTGPKYLFSMKEGKKFREKSKPRSVQCLGEHHSKCKSKACGCYCHERNLL